MNLEFIEVLHHSNLVTTKSEDALGCKSQNLANSGFIRKDICCLPDWKSGRRCSQVGLMAGQCQEHPGFFTHLACDTNTIVSSILHRKEFTKFLQVKEESGF